MLATVEEKSLTDKVIVFKYKRRKGYHKNQGHRSDRTIVRIDKIEYKLTEEDVEKNSSELKMSGPLIGL